MNQISVISKLFKSHFLIAIAAVLLMVCLNSSAGTPDTAMPADPARPVWAADHHMHVASPDICMRLGDCLPDHQPPAVLASDAIQALDQAQVQKGVVFSSAYLYALSSLGLCEKEIAQWTRRENEFTASEVSKHPDRLTGFFSLDALQPSALDELRHWQDSKILTGLKLHFTVSAMDLENPDHQRRLISVIQAAAAQELPIVMHIGGGDFDAADAEFFIQNILPHASSSWVQIAHAGGGLPLQDDQHVKVLRVFADHIESADPVTRKVLFDISYVPAPEEDQAAIDGLVLEMRRIGMDRFIFGSDYNVLLPREEVLALQRLDLSAREQLILRTNCAPWVHCKPDIKNSENNEK